MEGKELIMNLINNLILMEFLQSLTYFKKQCKYFTELRLSLVNNVGLGKQWNLDNKDSFKIQHNGMTTLNVYAIISICPIY